MTTTPAFLKTDMLFFQGSDCPGGRAEARQIPTAAHPLMVQQLVPFVLVGLECWTEQQKNCSLSCQNMNEFFFFFGTKEPKKKCSLEEEKKSDEDDAKKKKKGSKEITRESRPRSRIPGRCKPRLCSPLLSRSRPGNCCAGGVMKSEGERMGARCILFSTLFVWSWWGLGGGEQLGSQSAGARVAHTQLVLLTHPRC